MRFGFVTCVQLGLSCMEAIYDVDGELAHLFTLEDDMAVDKSGRVYLDDFATQHDVPLTKFRNINRPPSTEALKEAELDWLFIIGWSQIARPPVLDCPREGVIGMHPTLLPEGRGRAAIPWAILKGLRRTGVTMFKLDEGVDTGPILAQHEIDMHPGMDAAELYRLVDEAHISLMRDTYPKLASGQLALQMQDENKATVWPGRKPEDGRIDMLGSVHEAERLVRAVTHPYPGAFIEQPGRKTIVWKARIMLPEDHSDRLVIPFADGRMEALEYEVIDNN